RLAQLLEQDPRGVLHLRRPGLQVARMLGQERVRPLRAGVGLPRGLAQKPTDGLAIQGQLPGDLRLRPPLDVEQPVYFAPAVPSDHPPLPEWCDLGASVGVRSPRPLQQCVAHDAPLSGEGGGEISMTTGGDYWMTADSRRASATQAIASSSK